LYNPKFRLRVIADKTKKLIRKTKHKKRTTNDNVA